MTPVSGTMLHYLPSVQLKGLPDGGLAVQVVTISGRTIRKEAQAQPELSEVAIEKINELLAKVPKDYKQKAHDFRAQRRAVAA